MHKFTTFALGVVTVVATTLFYPPNSAQAMEVTWPSQPEKLAFEKIQTECVQTTAIPFGPKHHWKSCRLERAGFVATIGLQDFYFAEYCLQTSGKACDKQAQVLFRNRAYREEAFIDMARVDPAGTRYGNPLLVGSDKEALLATAVRLPKQKTDQRRYFQYLDQRWVVQTSQPWLQGLSERLPVGLSVRASDTQALPDPETMALRLPLYKAADRDCCATGGHADIRLAIKGGQFTVADVQLSRGGK